ncbi:bifunctional YncE family protein/alkaline phosphatase family protein [Aquisphaera insulae]|uniref:bifunctional YncE family protein/alkaline phosphatase family protein n=1 Tax=Aquisphaera insulae TaxID=2712864 RepID=UPI0013ED3EC0|nr:bifunctional YncE family protein/alkaline phosphatase family protein [Aquisphaera insulae]
MVSTSLGHRLTCGLILLVTGVRADTTFAQDAPAAASVKPKGARGALLGLAGDGTVLLPNGWSLKPAGKQSALGDFPVQIAVNPKGRVLAILHAGYGEHEVVTVAAGTGKVIGRVALPETFAGLAWSSDGSKLFVGGGFDDCVYRFDHAEGLLSNRAVFRVGEPQGGPVGKSKVPGGLALSSDGTQLWVANVHGHSLMRLDATAGAVLDTLIMERDSYPFGMAWDESAHRLYVSLWNRAAVAVVDTEARKVVATIATQEHPNEMLLAKGGKLLYVANANRNSVSVIDTQAGKSIETIGTAIDPAAPAGCTPSSLALTPDGSVLLVANANTNHVSLINVKEPGASTPLGFIPTGWYPTSVRLSDDGKTIYVANGKGQGSRANRDGPDPVHHAPAANLREYIGGLLRGTLSVLPMPGPKEMAAYSNTVYACSPVRKGAAAAIRGEAPPAGHPIPGRVGDPSPIKHVVYIIKENRTYDQVYGDVPGGNGEPSLCLFPEAITPNHHALAKEFVLLDNFYVDGEVSADGHEWTMGAYATDFVERTWPLSYRGDRRAPYPSEGALALATPAGGYLWDRAAEKGVSYRSYGEFVKNSEVPGAPATTGVKALQGHFDPLYRSFDMAYPDVRRAGRFLQELSEFEKSGEMPRLIVMRLPNDHTAGTRPGLPTVMACVGDNDLALGMVVEALSRSRFWRETAIFVIEDDAQNGSDHVDAHRTVALAISPYIRRGTIDSTMYSTSSMLRTMELILGLEPMSQFDASARPMFAAFTERPDFRPYLRRPAGVDLNEKNTRDAPMAEVSENLDLEIEDRADDLVFNEIIWKAVRGADAQVPPPVRAAFVVPR